ncbi:MAG: glycoside hydrolase family 3 N-terminal domain-containing protein, partial [Bacteroidota bacterium]
KEAHYKEIEKLVKNQKIGGLIFFQGNPHQQALLTNRYQAQASIPLMIAMDAEWGLGMRLDSTLSYPKQMTLGALRNDTLIYQMGQQIAEQAKRLGVHINFAPVVDINSNPLNPVIGDRSFGENKEKVAQKSIMYMQGMQEAGLMANAKHFPGHGDTESDSHFTLPTIQHGKQRLDSLELYPFKALIKEGVGSMMVAHLYMTQFDDRSERKKRNEVDIPATLSKNIVSGLLKDELGFQGLVFTDALNMKGVSAFYEPGEMDMMALRAGNDVLLFPIDVKTAIKTIKRAVKKSEMEEEEIDKKVKKILRAKYKMHLNRYQSVQTAGLTDSLNQFSYKRHRSSI